jgi:hypothetical protein
MGGRHNGLRLLLRFLAIPCGGLLRRVLRRQCAAYLTPFQFRPPEVLVGNLQL